MIRSLLARLALWRFRRWVCLGRLACLLGQGFGRGGIAGSLGGGDQVRVGVGRVKSDEYRRNFARLGPVARAKSAS